MVEEEEEEEVEVGYESWIFRPRLKQADSRSYYDDEPLLDGMHKVSNNDDVSHSPVLL